MDIQAQIVQIEENTLQRGEGISFEEATALLAVKQLKDLLRLFEAANRIREHFRGNTIDLCAITNAKSGSCSEDCSFCAQSAHHQTKSTAYPLITLQEMLARAKDAYKKGTKRFCIVTSGCTVSDEEFEVICQAITAIKEKFPALKMDASLGKLSKEQALKLKAAGLDRYNHNIETDKAFFSKVCTTHSFNDRLATLEILKDVGIERCSGGIIGLGETDQERIRMAFYLKELDVDCVPLNFLNPIAGTPFENNAIPEPLTLLKFVAIFRLILPSKQIRICGGRQANLRSLQSLIFYAGADAIIMGDYLTTKGSAPHVDLQMIEDAGLSVGN